MAAHQTMTALVAIVIVVVIMLVVMIPRLDPLPCAGGGEGPAACSDAFTPPGDLFSPQTPSRPSTGYPFSGTVSTPPLSFCGGAQLGRTSEGIDPLVTGQLYARSRQAGRGQRFILSGAPPSKPGCSNSSRPGCGPLRPLDPSTEVFDDGIPDRWRVDSRAYYAAPPHDDGDYYDPHAAGAVACVNGAQHLRMPDHDPLTN